MAPFVLPIWWTFAPSKNCVEDYIRGRLDERHCVKQLYYKHLQRKSDPAISALLDEYPL